MSTNLQAEVLSAKSSSGVFDAGALSPDKLYMVEATPANYGLLAELGDKKDLKVFFGNPRIILINGGLASRTSMRVSSLSSSAWLRLSPLSAITFRTLAKPEENHLHYLYPLFGFAGISSLFFEFMSLVVDPRWFVNIDKPARLSKIFSLFGLEPGAHAYSPWLLRGLPGLSSDSYVFKELKCSPKDLKSKNFCLRYRVMRNIVRFICLHWRHALSEQQGVRLYEEFEPNRFFNSNAVKKSYAKILKECVELKGKLE
jgi:hypothetical protein